MELQLFSESLAQGLLGQIVAGGAKTAGGDDNVSPTFGDVHRLLEPLRVVADYRMVVDVQPQLAELLGQKLGVQIDGAAQQKLGAHRQDFYAMAHKSSFFQQRSMGTRSMPSTASATSASTSSAASACSTSSSLGRVRGWRGVNTVQQSS